MFFAVFFELDGRLIEGEELDVLFSLLKRCLAIRLGTSSHGDG